ncbi:MAG TPA: addiction module protein [Candidatus Acidoferrales bacterium]|nr:addiction module protein [Candidatus Acidoferrales bacterium]
MRQEATELLKKALALSAEEREVLAVSLMDSLGSAEDGAAVEAAWNEEIARRIEELDSGKVEAIPWEEVRKRITSKLTHGR